MKEILKQALIEALLGTVFAVFLFVIGFFLLFLIGLAANTGSAILTVLSVVVALFVFVFVVSALLLLTWYF